MNALLRPIVAFNSRLGVSQWLRSIDYFRCFEYSRLLERLGSEDLCGWTLDWGPGTAPLGPCLSERARVVAVDVEPESARWQRRAAREGGTGRLTALQASGLRLPLGDRSVDRVLAIGSIEHALENRNAASTPGFDGRSDHGDGLAMREIGRVLKPGGRAFISVPWSRQFEATTTSAHTRSFERRYDDQALEERLLKPSGLSQEERVYFGEPNLRFSRFWYPLPFLVKLPFRRLIPWLAGHCLQELERDNRHLASGVFLSLTKTQARESGVADPAGAAL